MSNFSSREFRDVLGCFATGVAIVTTNYQGKMLGMTVNSFTSVSLDPPLVLWCLSKESSSCGAFSSARYHNIHVLEESQEGLSSKFASSIEQNKFNGADWLLDEREVPLIQNCKTVMHCEFEKSYDGGDHLILVAQVIDIAVIKNEKPLIFSQGKYKKLKD